MLTVIAAKLLWSVGGVVVGWLAKKWHFTKMVDALKDQMDTTPVERPK